MAAYAPGDRFIIVGLQSRAHLNGTGGFIESRDPDSDRWCVRLDDGSRKLFRERNMAPERVEENSDTTPEEESSEETTGHDEFQDGGLGMPEPEPAESLGTRSTEVPLGDGGACVPDLWKKATDRRLDAMEERLRVAFRLFDDHRDTIDTLRSSALSHKGSGDSLLLPRLEQLEQQLAAVKADSAQRAVEDLRERFNGLESRTLEDCDSRIQAVEHQKRLALLRIEDQNKMIETMRELADVSKHNTGELLRKVERLEATVASVPRDDAEAKAPADELAAARRAVEELRGRVDAVEAKIRETADVTPTFEGRLEGLEQHVRRAQHHFEDQNKVIETLRVRELAGAAEPSNSQLVLKVELLEVKLASLHRDDGEAKASAAELTAAIRIVQEARARVRAVESKLNESLGAIQASTDATDVRFEGIEQRLRQASQRVEENSKAIEALRARESVAVPEPPLPRKTSEGSVASLPGDGAEAGRAVEDLHTRVRALEGKFRMATDVTPASTEDLVIRVDAIENHMRRAEVCIEDHSKAIEALRVREPASATERTVSQVLRQIEPLDVKPASLPSDDADPKASAAGIAAAGQAIEEVRARVRSVELKLQEALGSTPVSMEAFQSRFEGIDHELRRAILRIEAQERIIRAQELGNAAEPVDSRQAKEVKLTEEAVLRMKTQDKRPAQLCQRRCGNHDFEELRSRLGAIEGSLVAAGVFTSVSLEVRLHRERFARVRASSAFVPTATVQDVLAECKVDVVLNELMGGTTHKDVLAVALGAGECGTSFRRRRCQERLINACDACVRAHDVKGGFASLQRALEPALEAALERSMGAAMTMAIDDIALMEMAHCLLRRARALRKIAGMDSAEDAEVAVQAAERAGDISAEEARTLSEDLLSRREALKRRYDLRRRLQAATSWASKDALEPLRRAIAEAEAAGCTQDELQSASEMLTQLSQAKEESELRECLRRARPDWTVKSLDAAVAKLASIGVSSVSMLRVGLWAQGEASINSMLSANGKKPFNEDTLVALRKEV